MAQTNKKRRRKRRGTQGGRVDTSPRRSRPRSREEAKAQARSRRRPTAKEDMPPTWRNSLIRGLFAAVIFAVLLVLLFGRPLGVALAFGAFMLAFYVPSGYYIDMVLWRRRERARIRSREG
jgi:Flp pilus assembly protein TadB